MSSSSVARLVRLHHATRFSSLPFLYPCCSTISVPVRRAMMSAIRIRPDNQPPLSLNTAPTPVSTTPSLSADAAAPQVAARPPPAPKVEKPRPKIRSTKAALSMTPKAVSRLRGLLSGPTPQLIRIGVRNKGCAGLSYNLEYVEKPGKFDEIVEQDGVRVLIDSKALFSIIGSEMDWTEDPLSSKFSFKNPNIKDACGCGESFTVGS
ncbi:Iron-sulfur assembly protein 1 [Hypsizygus marmoreus]|uniref:Iron-sulfur assembly protein 1 n=1 Tax=Hypsizygus marmoreus TaxID=39966 RepID=A0A369K6F3_HYPMA|nr:Iron-sulfur assembly protein 1 [Hypsizygus marmoreus]